MTKESRRHLGKLPARSVWRISAATYKETTNQRNYLKNASLPHRMHHTGILEDQQETYFANMYLGAKTKRFSRKDRNLMKILQIIFTEQEYFKAIIEDGGVFIGALWLEVERANKPKPRIIQCCKSLNIGHIATPYQNKQRECSRSSSEGQKHTDCTEPKESWNCCNCGRNHDATRRECVVFLQKSEKNERFNQILNSDVYSFYTRQDAHPERIGQYGYCKHEFSLYPHECINLKYVSERKIDIRCVTEIKSLEHAECKVNGFRTFHKKSKQCDKWIKNLDIWIRQCFNPARLLK